MSRIPSAWLTILLPLALLPGACAPAADTPASSRPSTRVVDACEDAASWSAHPADGVELSIGSDAGFQGRSLRLDFHFQGGGYAIARREVALDLPENYAFTFRLRGLAPVNHLEFKLVDATGENVWWSVQRDVQFPAEWESVTIKKRHLSFAWGPQGGGEIEHVAAIEFAITAGSGGSGTIWIDDLELRELPAPGTPPPPPVVTASSSQPGHTAAAVLDDDPTTSWAPATDDSNPQLVLDWQQTREYGGLILDWVAGRHASDYVVEASDDGVLWRSLRTIEGSNGRRDYLFLPEAESRYLRLTILRSATPSGPAVGGISLQPLSWSASREAFFMAIARDAPRGSYPRGISGEQVYWTVVGVDADAREGLLSEDGALETGMRRFSVEPFLYLGNQGRGSQGSSCQGSPNQDNSNQDVAGSADARLFTWADVTSEQSLAAGFLPMPSVTWRVADLRLEITAFGAGAAGASTVVVRYRVTNETNTPIAVTLFLALRPFQVNPPSQILNNPGGTAPIHELALEERTLRVDGQEAVVSLTPPARFGAVPFAGGDIVADYLRAGRLPADHQTHDPFGAASGALAFPLELAAGSFQEIVLLVPLYPHSPLAGEALQAEAGAVSSPEVRNASVRVWAEREFERCRQAWLAKIERVTIELPPPATRLVETLKSQLGYILVNRAGPAIQPGCRAYARSWIRDGALTSTALLYLGHHEPVRDFLTWYAPHQYDNGKVLCVVDARGADPVPEHDSCGEFIFLVAEYYRYTGDRSLITQMWPRVAKAADYLDALRQQRRTAEYRTPELAEFFGILPPSISHEGYSAKPMHSYWDDFFALRGFKDAVYLAGVLDLAAERARLTAICDEFQRDLAASVQAAMRRHGIDYVPGCADLGDFDPTATTIALAPTGAADILPPGALRRTFEKYYEFFRERRGGTPWEVYTPYEIRNVGACVRLGWRKRAHELLDFFFTHQRPAGWRHWAEVIWQQERVPHFIGDMPHTWVGSDYVRSALSMLAYINEDRQALVLGAGILSAWLEAGQKVTVRHLPTPYGELD